MNTVFARKVRSLVLSVFVNDVPLLFICAIMVSYTLFIDFQKGVHFILSQALAFAILVMSSLLWQITKQEGWGDFSLVFFLARRFVSGFGIYMVLMIPLGFLVVSDLIPNKWFIYLGLALCAGVLSDFGIKFGASENESF